MKKLSVLLSAIIFSGGLYGGNPADTGNFLAALQQKDAPSRTGALLNALENGTASNKEIIRFLLHELKKDNFQNKYHLNRLLAIWKKHPQNIWISHLSAVCSKKTSSPDVVIQQYLLRTLTVVELDKLSIEERFLYFDLLNQYTALLKKRRELPAVADLFDTLCRKYPQDLEVNHHALKWYKTGCFYETDAAPGLPTWELLKKNNVWKKRITTLSERVLDTPVKSAADADNFLSIAAELKLEEHLEEIPLWFQRYAPESRFWKNNVVSAGVNFSLPELFADADPVIQIVSFAALKKWDKIPELYKLIDHKRKLEMEIIVASAAGDHKFVRKRIVEEKFAPAFVLTKLSALTSAGVLRDQELLKVLRDDALKQKNIDPDLANAAGFVSAELDFELDKAEKLLKLALKARPDDSAFLDSYAWLLYKKGNFSESRKYMGRSLNNRPVSSSCSVLFLHAAIIEFAATHDKISARNYLERAERLYEENNPEYDRKAAEKLKEQLR